MIRFFLSACLLLVCKSGFAGVNIIGNGGHGVYINNQLHLLDLAEQANPENLFFKKPTLLNQEVYRAYQQRLADKFSFLFVDKIIDLGAQKMTELAELDAVYAAALMKTFEKLQWKLINKRLSVIPVETAINAPTLQIALRVDDVVLIDILYWQELPVEEQLALIFHEANYILIKPIPSEKQFVKDTMRARKLTGYIFSQAMQNQTPALFAPQIYPLFPSLQSRIEGKNIFSQHLRLKEWIFNSHLVIQAGQNVDIVSLPELSLEKLKSHICEQTERVRTIFSGYAMQVTIENSHAFSEDYWSFGRTSNLDLQRYFSPDKNCLQAVTLYYEEITAL